MSKMTRSTNAADHIIIYFYYFMYTLAAVDHYRNRINADRGCVEMSTELMTSQPRGYLHTTIYLKYIVIIYRLWYSDRDNNNKSENAVSSIQRPNYYYMNLLQIPSVCQTRFMCSIAVHNGTQTRLSRTGSDVHK